MKYTKRQIAKLNPEYLSQPGNEITEKVLNKIALLSDAIEKRKESGVPQPGDVVSVTTRHGDYYPWAHIEKVEDGIALICLSAYAPFSRCDALGEELTFSTSGGPWYQADIREFTFEGTREKIFKIWGNRGSGYCNSVQFPVQVNAWTWVESGQLYNQYSTKFYNKMYVCFHESDEYGYRITGNGIAWKNQKEYELWLETYRGVEFPDPNNKDGKVVFYWKEIEYFITRKKWDTLPYEIDTRRCNGVIFVKVLYDEKRRLIYTYRYTNKGQSDGLRLYMIAADRRTRDEMAEI